MISVAMINLKPGTAKTTSAVWTAHALHEMGRDVLLVDADPAASTLGWSEAAAEEIAGGFPFRLAALPSKEFHRRIGDLVKPTEVVVIDCPQLEDHAGITRSVMRWADHLVITVAPTAIEIERTMPIFDEIDDLDSVRRTRPRVSVLLNRVITGAVSGAVYRETLTDQGIHVLRTAVPRLELYAQSFGAPVRNTGRTAYRLVADELLEAAA